MYCEGGFRGGAIDVAQVTMTRAWRHTPARSTSLSSRSPEEPTNHRGVGRAAGL